MRRRLDRNRVVNSSFRIRPEVRSDLGRTAERDEQTVGDVTLRKAELLRADAIDFHQHLGRIQNLVKSDVDRAGNSPYPRLDLARDRVIRLLGVAGDLDIDRRGQTKV